MAGRGRGRALGVDLNGVLGMHYWAADKFNPVQLVTYMFMHGGFSHIFFNMFALFMFGSTLEQTWGGRRFLLYYLVCGVGAGVLQQVVYTIEFQPTLHALTAVLNSGSADSLMQYQDAIGKFFKTEFLQHATLSDVVHMRFASTGGGGPPPWLGGGGPGVFGILLAFGMLFPNTGTVHHVHSHPYQGEVLRHRVRPAGTVPRLRQPCRRQRGALRTWAACCSGLSLYYIGRKRETVLLASSYELQVTSTMRSGATCSSLPRYQLATDL